jgi:dephospho-CoA kinase
MLDALRKRFGAAVFQADGQLDRKLLGNVVFTDQAALSDLNQITHYYIDAEVNRQIRKAEEDGYTAVAVDAIALLEGGLAQQCDATIGIVAPVELRVARIMARENISEEYARLRIEAQKPDSYFRLNCDYILENGEDLEQFSNQVRDLMYVLFNE